MKPNPKYKPLTEKQFQSQWKSYLKGNPDVAIEYGNTFADAWKHYQERGVSDIQSGMRAFSSKTPSLIQEYGLKYPKEFGLIDPKTNRHTKEYTKYFPDQARNYIVENYNNFYDKDNKTFNQSDLQFLRDNKISADSIASIARNYGIGAIDANLLKYDSKKNTYATPELSPIAADVFVNYGNYDVGQKGIFDQADVSLLRSLGYSDADIRSRATNLFGDDKLSNEVIQQFFPNLVFRKTEAPPPGVAPELKPPTVPSIEAPVVSPIAAPTVSPAPPPPSGADIAAPVSAPAPGADIAAPVSAPAPGADIAAPVSAPTVSFPSWFKGIPGGSIAPGAPSNFRVNEIVNPIIDYFANAPIARAAPTLPYRFQTLTPENVDIRRGLAAIPTNRSLLALPDQAASRLALTQQLVSPYGQREGQVPAGATAPVPARMGGMVRYAQGGLANLGDNLASRGRYGDSMLVHMSPEEVQGLRALAQQQGMDMTINPQTGLPEAFNLKKLFKAVAPILPFLPIPGIQGLGLLAKSALSGVIGGFTSGKGGFNFKEGLKTGIMAFAGGKLMEGLSAAGQAGATTGPGGGGASSMAATRPAPIDLYGASQPVVPPSAPTVTTSMGDVSLASSFTGAPQASYYDPSTALELAQAKLPPNVNAPASSGMALRPSTITSAGPTMSMQGTKDVFTGASNLLSGSPQASSAFTAAAGVKPTTAALLGVTGYGYIEGEKERAAFEAQEAERRREEERRRREYAGLFSRTLGRVPMGANGGLVALARGGMPTFEYGGTTAPTGEPRVVKGAGDGMSDNVPANIEGVQEARLANDEFVVPADVVADIGNGSSSAGAKKLYAMMDRVRSARHGTTKQPPEIDAESLMPT
jgi:hypothetical protein